jgi:hypothetical protein
MLESVISVNSSGPIPIFPVLCLYRPSLSKTKTPSVISLSVTIIKLSKTLLPPHLFAVFEGENPFLLSPRIIVKEK